MVYNGIIIADVKRAHLLARTSFLGWVPSILQENVNVNMCVKILPFIPLAYLLSLSTLA